VIYHLIYIHTCCRTAFVKYVFSSFVCGELILDGGSWISSRAVYIFFYVADFVAIQLNLYLYQLELLLEVIFAIACGHIHLLLQLINACLIGRNRFFGFAQTCKELAILRRGLLNLIASVAQRLGKGEIDFVIAYSLSFLGETLFLSCCDQWRETTSSLQRLFVHGWRLYRLLCTFRRSGLG